ncbi:G patch domain-containing protein 4-like isoform X4 [Tribolium madens]|uniref:G patch domain-containing protein 4-like isoform X4 n=1 Tax=Tribolium madens TaxID=41895 RepID=UPI001CF72D94|nr:G patch domain-containing protein 4-like isoform X4 [Tribolium madens]
MSMLAERKVKQKWSLNPRGKAWSEDSSKFGQKMLEKLGWSPGKGLGAKENGIVEHVKISYKNDNKGMGFKETNQWSEHDSNFNALLQSLSGAKPHETDVKISSLEEKSQSSRVRVHYKKFTRGKDLSRCSEKDLANIFGKKSLKEAPKTPENETVYEEKNSFSHNAGSMVDYFKKKLPNFGKSNGLVGNNGVTHSEEETYTGFGFKKRKSSGEESNGTPKRIKKEENEGFSNPAFDPLYGNVEVQKHVLNTIKEEENTEESNEEKKMKKGVKFSPGIDNQSCQNYETNECESSQNSSNFEVKRKKKKKNEDCDEKSSFAIENPNFDTCKTNELGNSEISNNFEVKRMKKKKKNEDSFAIDNPNFDTCEVSELGNSHLSSDFEVKRKKKMKKNDPFVADNPNFETNETSEHGNSQMSSDFEVKRKKKMKKNEDSFAIDNPNFDTFETSELGNSQVSNDFEVKRKKKKNEDSFAIDNPNFDINCENGCSSNEFEVERKKTKRKNCEEIKKSDEESHKEEPEPTLDLILNVTATPVAPPPPPKHSSIKRRKSVRFSDVNEERIIPNNEENGLKDSSLDLDVEEMSKKIDGFQAEIENDMNEAKARKFIGEVGNPDGENEKLPDGGTRLKFKYAKFGRAPPWAKNTTKAKSSIKHLIKGDIVLGFNNTNLHEIVGYGNKKN